MANTLNETTFTNQNITVEMANTFKETTFSNKNITVEMAEMVFLPIFLDTINIIILIAVICIMYVGIEISHPLYALLFSNLIVTTISSLINVFIFPFVNTINYNNLVNGNSAICLLFHCSCWCIVSVLRYLYIIHKSWLDKTFQRPFLLLLLSLFGVMTLFSLGCFLIIYTTVQSGWPQIKLMNMPLHDKRKFVGVVIGSYFLLLGISCCFYIAILRKRGKFGHSGVGVQNDSVRVTCSQRSETPAGLETRSNPNLNDNCSTNSNDSEGECSTENRFKIVISFNRSQEKDIELKQRLKEISSAVRSLKTNFVLTTILSVSFAVSGVYSNIAGSVVITFAKGLFPILTTIVNFIKVQELVYESSENLTLWFAMWKEKNMCCS
jgi:hypothetical protein